VSKEVTEKGVKDKIVHTIAADLWKANITSNEAERKREGYGPPEKWTNPLMELPGFDGHADTPVEILHSILLGPVKYLMRTTVASLDKIKKATFAARLRSSSYRALDRPLSPTQMINHVGSLVGKDFRTFLQVAPFTLDGLVPPTLLDVWISLAKLSCLVYARQIIDIEEHVTRVGEMVKDLLCKVRFAKPIHACCAVWLIFFEHPSAPGSHLHAETP
jgi:hypothetical protein